MIRNVLYPMKKVYDIYNQTETSNNITEKKHIKSIMSSSPIMLTIKQRDVANLGDTS